MDLPKCLEMDEVREGDKYFFAADCPIGIKEHIHICICRKSGVLLLNTCSSQMDTSIRIARLKGYDVNTFPVLKRDDVNKFRKAFTYVNCNDVVETTEQEFKELLKQGKIHKLSGVIDEQWMSLIRDGLRLSTQIERRVKDLLE